MQNQTQFKSGINKKIYFKLKLIIISIVVVLHLSLTAFAVVIVFKDGKIIEAEKTWEKDGKVFFEIKGLVGFTQKHLIERIVIDEAEKIKARAAYENKKVWDAIESRKKKEKGAIEDKKRKLEEEKLEKKRDLEMWEGVKWGGYESKNSMTDEITKTIYIGQQGSRYFYIHKGTDSKCLLASFYIKHDILDSTKPPVFRVDKNKAIYVEGRSNKNHSTHSYRWFIGGCYKNLEQKIISQFLKGRKIRFEYYEFPDGVWHVEFPLYGFKQAYKWLNETTLNESIEKRSKQ